MNDLPEQAQVTKDDIRASCISFENQCPPKVPKAFHRKLSIECPAFVFQLMNMSRQLGKMAKNGRRWLKKYRA